MDGLGNVMVVSNVKYLAITFLVNVPTSALGPLSHRGTFVAIVLILQRGIVTPYEIFVPVKPKLVAQRIDLHK